MAKTMALFSGQGAQYPGMGKDLHENFADARRIYECAGDIFGFDVAKTSFDGTPEELLKTDVSQPVIFTLSVAAYTVARELLGEPQGVAGHSLGEYAALYCAGAYSLEDGMRILKARTAAMAKASRQTASTMYAIVGKDPGTIAEACAQISGAVWPVNFNLPTQTVIAGEVEPCAKAAALLEEQGAKVVKLDVEGAFHTPLMEPAARELREAAEKCSFSPLRMDFYSNMTGSRLDIENYPEYLSKHMLSPVRFVEQIQAMVADGYDTCIEYGPKRVVTMAKKNHKAFAACNVEDTVTLKKAQEALGKA